MHGASGDGSHGGRESLNVFKFSKNEGMSSWLKKKYGYSGWRGNSHLEGSPMFAAVRGSGSSPPIVGKKHIRRYVGPARTPPASNGRTTETRAPCPRSLQWYSPSSASPCQEFRRRRSPLARSQPGHTDSSTRPACRHTPRGESHQSTRPRCKLSPCGPRSGPPGCPPCDPRRRRRRASLGP